ncbi:MAG: glutamine--scyllo-inositol aminotransferase [Chloroflexi bacterium]|nr:MAG: glutamine--scyllo-inositol aminotransferase [Chloroflexota bacterium]
MSSQALAIHGGAPAKQQPDPPMYPGGMMIDHEEEAAVLEVLRSKRLFRYYGPGNTTSKVAELEQAYAAQRGKKYALAVTSGTASLVCALHGLGIGPGDEVIVPAFTWIATAGAVIAVGAVPIVCEVDESLLMDAADVEQKITPYTKAIIPVHMRGAPANMDAIMAVARKHNLKVVEDTAQANGATFKGQWCGAIGDVGCYSFQFNKMLTSGEGGMVLTDDRVVWQRAEMFHDVIGGESRKNPVVDELCGINFRMPELLAAVNLVQLRRLDWLLDNMRARKRMIKEGLADVTQRKGITFRAENDEAGDTAICTVFFVDSVETGDRVIEALRAENIGAGDLYRRHKRDYHVYAHWEPILAQRGWSAGGDPWRWANRKIEYDHDMCPRSLDLLGRAVHLNVSPLLTNEDVEETIEGVNKVLNALA